MKKFIIILLAVAALGITGCEKWLDVNHNPNDATKATPDLVLPGVLKTWLAISAGFFYHSRCMDGLLVSCWRMVRMV